LYASDPIADTNLARTIECIEAAREGDCGVVKREIEVIACVIVVSPEELSGLKQGRRRREPTQSL
jgi:hypothetical protein